jgi:uncharacterized protein YjbJ (UPF0337 family)
MTDESTKDQVTGRLKQAEGALTGDKARKRQGEAEEKRGEAREKLEEANEEIDQVG